VDGARPFTRREVVAALRDAAEPLWLVSFESPLGLVRSTNLRKDRAIRALQTVSAIAGEPVQVTTLGTSGTIRRASAKYL